jgi:hypothetical protein
MSWSDISLLSVSKKFRYTTHASICFSRPGGGFGFEEFRCDVEEGAWPPIQYNSRGGLFLAGAALAAAKQSVAWLAEAIQQSPFAQKIAAANFKVRMRLCHR